MSWWQILLTLRWYHVLSNRVHVQTGCNRKVKKKLKFKINTLNWGCEAWNSRLDKLDHRISDAFRELTSCALYCTQRRAKSQNSWPDWKCRTCFCALGIALSGGLHWNECLTTRRSGVASRWATRKMKPGGGGHVICHNFMRLDVYLMLSTFCRCMGITCNIWGRAQDPTQLPHKLRGDGSRACFRLSWSGLWQSLFDDYAGALGNYDIIESSYSLSSAQGRTFTFWVSWHEFQSYRAWPSAPAGAADSWCVYRCARYCTQLRNHRTLGHTEIA